MISLVLWWRQRQRNRQLVRAVVAGDAVRARQLLQDGANPNSGKLPLTHVCLERGDLFLFRLLVQHDALLGARNVAGKSVYEVVETMPKEFQRALLERPEPPYWATRTRRYGRRGDGPVGPFWPDGPGAA